MTDAACFLANKNGTNQGPYTDSNQLITFGTEIYDIGSYYDASSSTWTPPAGPIFIGANVQITGTFGAGSTGQLELWKNNASTWHRSQRAWTNGFALSIFQEDVANGTDYYTLHVYGASITYTVNGGVTNTLFYGHSLLEPAMAITQKHFRFRIDTDAVDATPTWGAAEDVGQ